MNLNLSTARKLTDNAVKISIVIVRMVPTRPGTIFSRDEPDGL